MSEGPRVSVVIPHLNEPGDLRRCLEALAAQQADGITFEVIVVDNGSRERPEFATAMLSDLRVLSQTIPGPGPTRNMGAAAARAPIIAFIDADCFADPGWLSAIVHYFDGHPEIAFVGGDIRIHPANAAKLTAIEAYESIYSYRARLYVERYGFAASGNLAVRAEVFRQVGPFGGIGTMEDTEWGQRATAMGCRIGYLPDARVYTPSCKSFAELARRWDRHVAHEFRETAGRPWGTLRWLLKAVVMALSPLGEVVRVAVSDRVHGWRERWLALTCITRVRLYRARRMFGLARHDNATGMLDMWNREGQ